MWVACGGASHRYMASMGMCSPPPDPPCTQTFACRTIYKSKLCSLQELRDVQQEVRLYQGVARSGSPHIVQFIQSFEDKQYLHIITEVRS